MPKNEGTKRIRRSFCSGSDGPTQAKWAAERLSPTSALLPALHAKLQWSRLLSQDFIQPGFVALLQDGLGLSIELLPSSTRLDLPRVQDTWSKLHKHQSHRVTNTHPWCTTSKCLPSPTGAIPKAWKLCLDPQTAFPQVWNVLTETVNTHAPTFQVDKGERSVRVKCQTALSCCLLNTPLVMTSNSIAKHVLSQVCVC